MGKSDLAEWAQGEHLWLKVGREGKGHIFVVRRKLGNAVERNRLKRRLRSVVRGGVGTDQDLVVLARSGAVTLKYAVLKAEFQALVDELCGRGVL